MNFLKILKLFLLIKTFIKQSTVNYFMCGKTKKEMNKNQL